MSFCAVLWPHGEIRPERFAVMIATHLPSRLAQLIFFAAVSCVLGLASLFARESVGPLRLSFEQAIAGALRGNPGLQARTHAAAAARDEAQAVNRSRFGDLNAIASYGYYSDDLILRPMSRELMTNGIAGAPWDREQLHYGVVYDVPLFVGGRLSNQVALARLEAQKANALREGTRWQVRFNAVSLYAAAQALDRMIAGLREQISALEQTKANLDQMVGTGKRPELDRLKVLDELAAAQAQHASAQADRVKVGALLLAVLGRDPAGTVIVDPLPDAPPPRKLDRAELQTLVMDNTAVQVAQLERAQASRSVSVARSAFLPKVVGSANYQEHVGLGIDRTLETWGFSVGVTVPLFSGTADVRRLRAARERVAASRETLAQAQAQAAAALQDAMARLDASQAALAAAEARVVVADEAARIERVRYDTGAGTIEDLLRTVARKQGAGAALAAARADQITAEERINSIVEKDILK